MSREELEPDETLMRNRREVEERLAEIKASIGRELGVVPKAKYTLLAVVAGAAGLALASRRRRKKRKQNRS